MPGGYNPRIPTSAANQQRIKNMSEKVENRVAQLWARWQDEKGFEDFAEYGAAMKACLAEVAPTFTFVQARKRPFGFTFKIDGFDATYSIEQAARTYGWKRIG